MKLILTTLALVFFQVTLVSQIYLTTQEEIDNFYNDYPVTTLSTSVRISGNAIKNLDSLYRLDSIKGFLMIVDTELEDLKGLENLTFVRSLTLKGNENLKNYEGISNLESFLGALSIISTKIDTFPYFPNLQMIQDLIIYNNSELLDISNLDHLEFGKISINDNSNLSICAISAICDHLLDFKEYSINNNSSGCRDREQILLNCSDYEPCYFDQSSVLYDFDSWNNSNLPDGWIGKLDTIELNDNTLVNITQAPSITNNNGHALNLTTFTSPWRKSIEGNIELVAYNPEDYIDVSFDYCFMGATNNNFFGEGSLLVNDKEFWNTGSNTTFEHVNCSSPRKAEICNIPISQGLDSISITLRNKSFYSSVDGTISSSWIIDNLMINNVEITSNIEEANYSADVELYPNPTSNIISVRSNINFSNYKVYDILTNEVISGDFNKRIDISSLKPGLYIFVLQSKNYSYSKKIIKQ